MAIDETGKRFGKLTVLAPAGKSHNRAKWLCQCDCGNKEIIQGRYLRKGKRTCCVPCAHRGERMPTPAETTKPKKSRRRNRSEAEGYQTRKWVRGIPPLSYAYEQPFTPEGNQEFLEILTAQNSIPGAEIKRIRQEALKRSSQYESIERCLLRLLVSKA